MCTAGGPLNPPRLTAPPLCCPSIDNPLCARLQAEMMSLRQEASSLRSQLAAADSKHTALQAEHSSAQLNLLQANMSLSLMEQECDGLKRLVTLLEGELQQGPGQQQQQQQDSAAAAAAGSSDDPMAVDGQQQQQQPGAGGAGGSSAAVAAARLALLQTIVDQLKDAQQQLQGQLKAAVAAESSAQSSAASARAEAQEAAREAEELAVRCQALEVGGRQARGTRGWQRHWRCVTRHAVPAPAGRSCWGVGVLMVCRHSAHPSCTRQIPTTLKCHSPPSPRDPCLLVTGPAGGW